MTTNEDVVWGAFYMSMLRSPLTNNQSIVIMYIAAYWWFVCVLVNSELSSYIYIAFYEYLLCLFILFM